MNIWLHFTVTLPHKKHKPQVPARLFILFKCHISLWTTWQFPLMVSALLNLVEHVLHGLQNFKECALRTNVLYKVRFQSKTPLWGRRLTVLLQYSNESPLVKDLQMIAEGFVGNNNGFAKVAWSPPAAFLDIVGACLPLVVTSETARTLISTPLSPALYL